MPRSDVVPASAATVPGRPGMVIDDVDDPHDGPVSEVSGSHRCSNRWPLIDELGATTCAVVSAVEERPALGEPRSARSTTPTEPPRPHRPGVEDRRRAMIEPVIIGPLLTRTTVGAPGGTPVDDTQRPPRPLLEPRRTLGKESSTPLEERQSRDPVLTAESGYTEVEPCGHRAANLPSIAVSTEASTQREDPRSGVTEVSRHTCQRCLATPQKFHVSVSYKQKGALQVGDAVGRYCSVLDQPKPRSASSRSGKRRFPCVPEGRRTVHARFPPLPSTTGRQCRSRRRSFAGQASYDHRCRVEVRTKPSLDPARDAPP